MKAANEQTPMPESPFLRKQAKGWKLSRILFILLIWIILLVVVSFSVFVAEMDIFNGFGHVIIAFLYACGCIFSFLLSVAFVKYLNRASITAYRLLEQSVPYHYLFCQVDFNDDSSSDLRVNIRKYFGSNLRFSKVNEKMSVRLEWFAFNSYPRIYPWQMKKFDICLNDSRDQCGLHLSIDKTYKVDCAIGIMLSIYLVMNFLMPVGCYYDIDHGYLFLIMQLGILGIYFIAISVRISQLGYKAALIKLLSDKWPWERF